MKPLIILVAALVLASCQKDHSPPKSKATKRQSTELQSTLQLPNGDGVVYVIESPADDFGIEVNTCMLHVKGDHSTIACTPPKLKLPDTAE